MNKTKLLLRLFALLAFTLLAGSCTTRKTFTYLQDVELAKTYVAEQDAQLVVRPGDRLNVHVGSLFPELVAPLNGGSYQMVMPAGGGTSTPKTSAEADSRAKQLTGYLVDKAGYITMPILGEIYVQGKTLAEVKDVITTKILEGKHVSDPMVEVRFANFKVYLLGAINRSSTRASSSASASSNSSFFTRINGVNGGVLRVYDKDKINILEALALAGDLSVEAKVDKVDVIRQSGNKYVTYRLNLKSADIFSSPAFYLHQDDIVYIEYRYRGQQPVDRGMQLLGYGFSAISTIVSLLTLLAIYKK